MEREPPDLRGRRLEGADLAGAHLAGADLRGARLIGGSLRDADLAGSRWEGAALLGVDGVADSWRWPELDAAAVIGRDPAEPMVAVGGMVRGVAFSPDGRLVAVGRWHAVEIVDAATARPLRVLGPHTGEVESVAFDPGGALLAAASRDGAVRIWVVPTGELSAGFTVGGPLTPLVAFSPDGHVLAVVDRGGGVRMWDVEAGAVQRVLPDPDGSVRAMAFSADGTMLATGHWGGTVRVHDVAGAGVRAVLRPPRRRLWRRSTYPKVVAVRFSAEDCEVVAVMDDGTIAVGDVAGGRFRAVGVREARYHSVAGAAFSSDGTRVVLVPRVGARTLPLHDMATGAPAGSLEFSSEVRAVGFSPDGSRVAAGIGRGELVVRDLAGDVAHEFSAGRAGVWDTVYTRGGCLVASHTPDGVLQLWDAATASIRAAFPGERHRPSVIKLSPDGRTVATQSFDDTHVWDAGTGALRCTVVGGWASGLAFSPDGRWIVTSGEQRVSVWDTATGALRAGHATSAPVLYRIVFSPAGTMFAAGDNAGVQVWTVDPAAPHRTLSLPQETVRAALAFSPNGLRLATAGKANGEDVVRVWVVAGGGTGRALVHPAEARAAAFSPDGHQLAVGCADGCVRLWDLAHHRVVRTLEGHLGAVKGVSFSPNGARLATTSTDGAVHVWHAGTGAPVFRFTPLTGGRGVALFADGSYTLTGEPGEDLWWAVKLCRFAPGELDPFLPRVRSRTAGEAATRRKRG